MALGPNGLELTQAEQAEVEAVEKEIDESLLAQYSSNTNAYKVTVGVHSGRIMNEIRRRYSHAGWSNVYLIGEEIMLYK